MAETPSIPPTTQPHVVLVVIYSLALLALCGFVGTFLLVREKVDGASIAVFSGLTGTVLGGLMSTLNNTRTATPSNPNESTSATLTVSAPLPLVPNDTKNPIVDNSTPGHV